jgi:alanine dehydrogenase
MKPPGTLLLGRRDVAALLGMDECIAAVELAFRLHAEGKTMPPGVLGVPSRDGGFHIKAAGLELRRRYFAAKVNGNFFQNMPRYGMPNIQGVIVLCDGDNGYPLALLDSIEITILRTGAATAVAAKYLALDDAAVATIVGCGNQGRVQLRSIARVRPIQRVFAYDSDADRARCFAEEMSEELLVEVIVAGNLAAATRQSQICVTCTPSSRAFLGPADVTPGAFVAAVGADNPQKQEIDPALLASATIVVDILEQAATIGDLHHAIAAGLLSRESVHAELGDVVANRKPGRTSAEEIIVFDSTGTALQDAAAAALVYEKAVSVGRGAVWHVSE